MPAQNVDFLFLSSGTWSLIGSEIATPVVNEESRTSNFTNEGGINHTIRFLKNIMGLWIVQECRRHWSEKEAVSYAQLAAEAEEAEPFACLINPDDPLFLAPGDMPQRISDYLIKTGQNVPRSRGGFVRCIYESLAMAYRSAALSISRLTNKSYDTLHAVGGGTNAALLMQMTADALNMKVLAGPAEATAIGNAMMQLIALGAIKDVAHGRRIVALSSSPRQFMPSNSRAWDDAFERYLRITKN